jgi:hypothetical protein
MTTPDDATAVDAWTQQQAARLQTLTQCVEARGWRLQERAP